jgi:hypothetical protein
MARVVYGSIVTDLAGSIGGTTFQMNSSGAIARSRAYTPVAPSPDQSVRQLALSRLVFRWPSVDLPDKQEWSDLAAAHTKLNDWGKSVKLNGYQWFLSYNLNRFTQGLAPVQTPDSFSLVDEVPPFIVDADADDIWIDFGSVQSFPGTYAGIYMTTPLRQTSINLRRSTFLIKLWTTENTRYITLTPWFEASFNIVWSTFYSTAQAALIVRMKNFHEDTGYASPFTSNILMIG